MSNIDSPMPRKLGQGFMTTLLVLVVIMFFLLGVMASGAQAPVNMVASDGITIILASPYDLWVQRTFEADPTGVSTWLFGSPTRLVFMATIVVGIAFISVARTAGSYIPNEDTDESSQ